MLAGKKKGSDRVLRVLAALKKRLPFVELYSQTAAGKSVLLFAAEQAQCREAKKTDGNALRVVESSYLCGVVSEGLDKSSSLVFKNAYQ